MQMTQTEKVIIEPHKLPLSANGMVDGGWQLDLKIKKKKKKKSTQPIEGFRILFSNNKIILNLVWDILCVIIIFEEKIHFCLFV